MRQLLRPTPPDASPRVLSARFFASLSAPQLEDSFSDLTSFLSPTAPASPGFFAAPGLTSGLCSVPFLASAISSGFFATKTLFGALIMARMAAASSSALVRRSCKSLALATSAAAWAFSAAAFSAAFSAAFFAAKSSALGAAKTGLASTSGTTSAATLALALDLPFAVTSSANADASGAAAVTSAAATGAASACTAADSSFFASAACFSSSRWRIFSARSSSWRRINSA